MASQRDDSALPGLPPPEVLRAYAEQSTDEVRAEARRYAESRVPMYRRAGLPIPKNYASELVADALADTWLGDEPWNPAKCSLLVHLRGAILSRTWNEIRRGVRFRRLSLDLPSSDPQWTRYDHGALDSHERSLAHASFGDCREIMLCTLTLRVCSELRAVAEGDADAGSMLACWEASFIERDDVIELTGMSENAYKAARTRLLRMSKHLPPDLRETAEDLLRSAS